ncbi:MAG: response regulator [Planctomycetota bacterium]
MQKVLIADKDPAMREYYAQLVQALGHYPLTCRDGIAALDCATANPNLGLILMDLDLPGTWGQQLVEVLRSHTELSQVPILVVSSKRTHAELMRLVILGIHQWFEKPPAAEELSAAIQLCLEKAEALDIFDVEDTVPVPVGAGIGAEGSWLLAV